MDTITTLIKNEIKAQYKTIKRFSDVSGIPYSTLSNALSKGIGGTSYETVVKICRLLNLKQINDSDIVLFNDEFHDIYSKLTHLDEQGVHTVCAVLNVEYARCAQKDETPTIKAFNGIGYAAGGPEKVFDENRIQELVKRVREDG